MDAFEIPQAEIATLSGSVMWNLTTTQFAERAKRAGFNHTGDIRPDTPYGAGPIVQHFVTPSGRSVIRIPSYGVVAGEFTNRMVVQQRVFSILYKAGVKVIIVGGTSGTNDWRGLSEEAIWPGDLVLPWSFYRSEHMVGYLPVEQVGGVLPNLALMKEPFCPSLAEYIKKLIVERYTPSPFRKVHSPNEVKVALRSPSGGSFESEFETLAWRHLTRLISEEEKFPYVVLHGDCISPILTRHLGAHLLYYHVPVNWAEGHPAGKGDIVGSLDPLYLDVLPDTCSEMELYLLDNLPIPDDCSCIENLVRRPNVYQDSLSPAGCHRNK